MIKELCQGTYSATQHDKQITIFAIGSHPTTGYVVYFEPYKMQNTYGLFHERPQGIVGQMVTPFAVHTSYYHAGELKSVTVIDATGRHDVPVIAVPEKQLAVAHGGGGIPSPFGVSASEGDKSASAPALATATGTGSSTKFSFEEALQNAIADARHHLPYVPDLRLKIEVTSIRAEVGGLIGLQTLVVQVIASH